MDSGAADVSIPADVVGTLIRTGTLTETDFVGEQTYRLADGSRIKSKTFRIRQLKVGDRVMENVLGSVADVKGSLLLGQSFLSRFKKVSFDYGRLMCNGEAQAGGSLMHKWRGLAVVACMVLGMSGAARAGWLDDAIAALGRGDYQTALNIFKPRAEQGNAAAQYILGVMYDNGLGVAQDYKTAVKWYKLAAEQGYEYAQYGLGLMYHNGKCVAQDYKTAAKWYQLAADQGFVLAQYNLGFMYDNGWGVAQDYKTAAKLFTQAAQQGHARAQYNLGSMYAKGQGVAQHYIKAHMWFNIAAIGGDKQATQNRDEIATRLTPNQITWAQELASQCVAQKFLNCGS